MRGDSFPLGFLLGLLFLVMAARQWRKRPAKGEEATMPGWMSSVEHFTPAKSLGLGLALDIELVLKAGAAAAIDGNAQCRLAGFFRHDFANTRSRPVGNGDGRCHDRVCWGEV